MDFAPDEDHEEIARLRQIEKDYREQMQAHLQEVLAKVEANAVI